MQENVTPVRMAGFDARKISLSEWPYPVYVVSPVYIEQAVFNWTQLTASVTFTYCNQFYHHREMHVILVVVLFGIEEYIIQYTMFT